MDELFVSLQSPAVDAKLAALPSANLGNVGELYVDDKTVWSKLVLAPVGPSAMLLGSVAEMSDVDQGPLLDT
ncbi:hypothetical protein NUW54_g9167 [Trametes sanguinea]|uniref:Uncharacterized protein n=1 Tax=Trametes sanguinea TaxID=158606 RepID=A0ACC1P9R9_9APHY|nr:hypothetical protein NUW54_g9167 [Trametes sanguinea]